MEQQKEPEQCETAEDILITQYVNPQLFCYVKLEQLQTEGGYVRSMEKRLPKFCRPDRQRTSYWPDKYVIVNYRPVKKLLRGLVVASPARDRFLVWAIDYGFTINCRTSDLYQLPYHLHQRYINVEWGGIHCVVPHTGGSWSKVAARLLDKRLDEAKRLIFKLRHCSEEHQNLGQLLMDEPPVDAASYLVEMQCARMENEEVSLEFARRVKQVNQVDVAELNEADVKPSLRVLTVLQLGKVICSLPAQVQPHVTSSCPLSKESQQYLDSILGNRYHKLGSMTRNLTCPSKQLVRLEGLSRIREKLAVPQSAKRLSRIKSRADGSVDTALSRPTEANKVNKRNVVTYYKKSLEEVKEKKTEAEEQSKNPPISANRGEHDTDSLSTIQQLPEKPTEVQKPSSNDKLQLLSYGLSHLSSDQNPSSKSANLESTSEPKFVKTIQPYQNKVICVYDRSVKRDSMSASPLQTSSPNLNILKQVNRIFIPKAIMSSENQPIRPDKLKAIPDSYKITNVFTKPDNLGHYTLSKESIKPTQETSLELNSDKLERIYKEYSNSNNKPPVSNNSLELQRIYNAIRLPVETNAIAPKICSLENQVLAHSKIPVQPVHSLGNSLFCPEVLLAMQTMNMKPTQATQRYAWPHLMQGHSLALVDRIGSGRSWCYLPPLCSQVVSSMGTTGSGVSLGPVALLLADSVANAQALFHQCDQLMTGYKTNILKVVNSHAHSRQKLRLRLLNSCGILVTTPTHLKQLLQDEMQLIDPRRLKHFIIDDFDRMYAAQSVLLNELLQLLQSISKLRLQLVLIAQQWHGKVFLELLRRFDDNPLLLFGDFLEAAVYGRVKLNVAVLRSNRKIAQLLDYLAAQHPLQRRTIIYCKDEKELAVLRKALTEAGYDCLESIDAARQQVKQLLLATDAVQQPPLSVGNFELMIHYSLPDSWSKFSYRFRVFSENIINCLLAQKLTTRIVSFVILDESNSHELPRLVQFFEAHDFEMSEQMQQMVASCRQLIDESRQLCPQILSSGECVQLYCNRRHQPIRGDFQRPCQAALSQPGTVLRGNIIKVYNPVHFAIMPVSFRGSESHSWQDAPNMATLRRLSTALELHMSIGQNRRPKRTLNMSDVCVLHRQLKYQRVRIVDLSERLVIVQQMDEGTELLKVQSMELFECDARFAVEPPLAMDVRLCGLMPPIGEDDWQKEATAWVTKLLTNLNENQHLQLTVELSMLNVVYANDMAVLQDCPALQTCVRATQLYDELILRNYAKSNEQIIKNLHKLHVEVVNEQTRFQQELPGLEAGPRADEEAVKQNELDQDKAKQDEGLEEIPKITDCVENGELMQSAFSCQINSLDKYSNENVKEMLTKSEGIELQHDSKSPFKNLDNTNDESEKIDTEINIEKENDCPANHLINKDTLASKESIELQEELQEELQGQPSDSTYLKDSMYTFMEILLKDLNSDDAALQDAAKNMMEGILATDKTSPQKPNTPKLESNGDILPKSKLQLTPARLASALCCAAVADNAVRPRVCWHQTLLQLELIIEQEVPQYQLVHRDNVLFYQVTETTPPQRCILNLLGEVKILSEQQHGYRLHIKLAKVGLRVYWPTLLDSLSAQQHCHWLVYDTERAKIPHSNAGRIHWMRYIRKQYVQQEGESDDGDDWPSDDRNDLSDIDVGINETADI
ncbi:PREDICTED: putative ATP-dependent RNA helicase SoYb [Drosophila arizonae]|uniref:RNA helicase n=1 Tax=Drosophila arizonae TaxID=7263 RepID=A0ABM1NWB2_DROAR|nr:PREDICTED: putative ATP-dependent RNA helicase SoYb [Drosophila arizonae]